MTATPEQEPIHWTPEQRARLRELAAKGGRAGSPEAKRAAAKKAWSNPDPSKRPGRKKGSPWKKEQQESTAAPRPAAATLGDDYNRIMEQLQKD